MEGEGMGLGMAEAKSDVGSAPGQSHRTSA